MEKVANNEQREPILLNIYTNINKRKYLASELKRNPKEEAARIKEVKREAFSPSPWWRQQMVKWETWKRKEMVAKRKQQQLKKQRELFVTVYILNTKPRKEKIIKNENLVLVLFRNSKFQISKVPILCNYTLKSAWLRIKDPFHH